MIIEMFLSALYNVFDSLTKFINIPSMPPDIDEYIGTALDYMQSGVGILANYTNINYLLTLFGLIIAIDIGIGIYHFVMWIIRKIPMASIS